MSELQTPRIAILASGNGTTAEAFIEATQNRIVDAEVGLVVCSKPPEAAGIYERVANLNRRFGLDIETAWMSRVQYPGGEQPRGQTLDESEAIARKIQAGGYGHIALMGYMLVVNGALMEEYGYLPETHVSIYQGRMSNTHPGPLPETEDTYGIGTQRKVLELYRQGLLRASRHSVHLVAPGVDRGPVLSAVPVPITEGPSYREPGDTPEELFDRVQVIEKSHLPIALHEFLGQQADWQRIQGDLYGPA